MGDSRSNNLVINSKKTRCPDCPPWGRRLGRLQGKGRIPTACGEIRGDAESPGRIQLPDPGRNTPTAAAENAIVISLSPTPVLYRH